MQITEFTIRNFRGIKDLTLELDSTTVLIGENNSGKTTVLHALRACLSKLRNNGRAVVFDEYDFHLDENSKDPTQAEPIELILTFQETDKEWPAEIEQQLGGDGGIISFIGAEETARIRLKVIAKYSAVTGDVETEFNFLDANENPLANKNRSKLYDLQQLRPLFYLSALRDASREFSKTSQFWSPFIKNSQITEEKKKEIEEQLVEINQEIINAHGTFKHVQEHLSSVQKLVSVAGKDTVSVDALPARVFDMLSRTQVNIASVTGAKLPISRHGEGTQSLSVLMLFDVFLKSELQKANGTSGIKPIVALEEPEAHLHPTAIRALWKTISKINGQKVIATHSGDLLSEVDPLSIRRLYRSEKKVKIGQLPKGLFHPDQMQMFDYWVRRTRGELFFAKTWILVEGATEIILLSGAAKSLGVDLEQYGVRLVEFSQNNVSVLIRAAKALGIAWHVFTDGDPEGVKYFNSAKKEVMPPYRLCRSITIIPSSDDIEPYLYKNGFSDIFEAYVSEQKRNQKLKVDETHADYPMQIVKCLSVSKTEMAHHIVSEMLKQGSASVPKTLRLVIYKAAALSRRKL